jgi:hypothetical protein
MMTRQVLIVSYAVNPSLDPCGGDDECVGPIHSASLDLSTLKVRVVLCGAL